MFFLLVHSPLAGPFTWELTAAELAAVGHVVVVPALTSPAGLEGEYWRRHVHEVLRSLGDDEAPLESGIEEPAVIVGHSGAGPLLPLIGRECGTRPAAYLFVDAALPTGGKSRLEAFPDQALAETVRRSAVGGVVPAWPEEVVAGQVPDPRRRRRVAAELGHMPLAVMEERLPEVTGWPDAPCGYVQFSAAYDVEAEEANGLGWWVEKVPGTHFHMVNEPREVAEVLVRVTGELVRPASFG